MNQSKRQKLILIKGRLYYQFGGITKEPSTLNSCQATKRSTQLPTKPHDEIQDKFANGKSNTFFAVYKQSKKIES